jgi:phthiocerol/phenolphthiocerol synthesis type-I polyketide synthase E
MAGIAPIAVIGMAGRFPGAANIDEFWAKLVAGTDCLDTLTDDELLAWGERPERLADSAYVRRRPRLNGIDLFDAALFGMTPREAEALDPQHRLFLEIVHATLEHGGYDPSTYPGHIGLYAGANSNRYRYDHVERNAQLAGAIGDMGVYIGGSRDFLTTFVSYKLDLRGPSMCVLTACSTALVSVHVACNAIRDGDCDMAVAGGVDLEFPVNRGYNPLVGGHLSVDGVVRPFDERASGTNFGNGTGAVLLKSLDRALADGDTVYAVIRGTAINNDGAGKVGFTAPGVAGQSECIQRALRNAGVDPREISYVEAHATATPVGDPIEVTALIDAYRAAARDPLPAQYCDLGTVKSNIGHLGQAAGIAGLIKTVLALWHGHLPPSINVTAPTPAIDWTSSPFRVIVTGRPWPRTPAAPRVAGVSSFGVGSTNAHAIVAEAPPPAATTPSGRLEAVLWSGVDEAVVARQQEVLADHFDRLPDAAFGDTAHTLRVGRAAHKVRRAVVAGGTADAAAALRDPARVLRSDGVRRSLVFGFPGQGAQYPRMLHTLYDEEPLFRRGCDAAFEVLAAELDSDPREAWRAGDEATLAQTAVAQPLLFALEFTLAHCLLRWGPRPRAVFGHSLGELVAAAVAGVFDFEAGLRAVAARARLMQEASPGRMIAVAAAPDEAAELLVDGCALAAVNGDRQIVLAGPDAAMPELVDRLVARDLKYRPLRVLRAFHTAAMGDAAERWRAVLATMTLHEPEIPIISCATGAPVTAAQATSPDFWSGQLVAPVDFRAAAAVVLAGGPDTVVEVGPGRTLALLLRGRPDLRAGRSRVLCLAPETPGEAGHRLEEALAHLWVDGAPVAAWLDRAPRYRRVAAPGYPYQRQRYWADPEPTTPVAAPALAAPAALATWALAEPGWVRDRTGRQPGPALWPRRGSALVYARGIDAVALRSALGRAGYRVSVVDTADGFDATDVTHWAAALDRQGIDDRVPDLIVHAALLATGPARTPDRIEAQVDQTVLGLYACAQAVVRLARAHRAPTRLVVLGHHLVDVSGAEPVNPAAAVAPALLGTLAQEVPDLAVSCLDVAAGTPEDVLARELAEPAEPLVALRGAARWLPTLRDLPAAVEPARSRLRHRGTYLVTGGLGGIGLAVARGLAETGLEPRLGLLGRTGSPRGDSPAARAARADLAAIVASGARVEAVRADVTDLATLESAVARIEHRFGPVDGVVHAAGVPGGGLLEHRDPADVRRVLAPKTSGVLNLDRVFARRPELDFLVLFSSQAAIAGLFGSADYAAANAFLDAYAHSVTARERFTVSVQWPAWAGVGMAARSTVDIAALAGGNGHRPASGDGIAVGERVGLARIYEPGRDWELDDHRIDGVGTLPGSAQIELALLAARATGRYPAGDPVDLYDVVFLRPLSADQAIEVRVLLLDQPDGCRFRVQRRLVDGAGPWVDHTYGEIRPGAPAPASDLDTVRSRLTDTDPNTYTPPNWVAIGARWRCVVDSRGSTTERLARMALPSEARQDVADHPFHPGLVDAATAVVYDVPPGRRFVPFMYGAVRVFAPLPADVLVHARSASGAAAPSPVDLDFYAPDTGELLVRVVGVTRREFGGAADEAASRADGAGTLSVADGAGTLSVADGAGTLSVADGGATLSVADGTAAFLAVLAGNLPPVVTVEPAGSRPRVTGTRAAAPEQAARPAPAAPASRVPVAGDQPDRARVVSDLRQLWSDALGVPGIGVDDDFFELGGNSLVAVMLVNKIKERFDVNLGAGALFDHSTIGALADQLCR